jgi:D-alanyl-D-alanine carboxypeptidase
MIDRDVAPRQRFTVGQLRQIQRALVPPPETSAVSVLVYDLDSGRELMTKAARLPVSPASLAKLMTALLVFEQNRLEEQVTILQEDLVGEAAMGLSEGEELRVEELLWGLLIPSGNDAAMALARHHSGQVEDFVRHMNLRAGDLGMHRTQFHNPSGFDADGQVSSAQDLLTLVRRLWEYPLFRQIVGTPSATVASHELQTTNRLLGAYPGVNGVKTGTTLQSGQSLIVGLEQNGHQLFAVVLGSLDRYHDVRLVLQAVQGNYSWVPFHLPGRPTALDRLFDAEGKRWFLRTDGFTFDPTASTAGPLFEALLAGWERQELKVFRRVHSPPSGRWDTGMQAGVLEWRLGDTVIATQRLLVQ